MPTLVPSWYFMAPSFLKIQKLGAKKYRKIDFLLRTWTNLKANENRLNQGQVNRYLPLNYLNQFRKQYLRNVVESPSSYSKGKGGSIYC